LILVENDFGPCVERGHKLVEKELVEENFSVHVRPGHCAE
jgi:hypothetical protein